MKKLKLSTRSGLLNKSWIGILLFILALLSNFQTYADGAANGNVGVFLTLNGTQKEYNVFTGWDAGCTSGVFLAASSQQSFSGVNLGHISSLALNGLAIVGWTNNADFVSGNIEYRIWLSSGSKPGTATGTFNVGGYGSACSVVDVQCSSNNNRLVGWNGSSVDLFSGLAPGVYSFEIISHGQMRYNCGSYNQVDNAAVTASFTVDPVVTFNINGGSSGTMANQTVPYNTSTALTVNSYTRTGYTFSGWNTVANGSGTSYANQANVTLTANTTLYAQWLAAAVPIITGVTSSIPTGSTTQTYKGATITVTGTTLGSVTTVKLGGSVGTTITGATIGSTQITFTVPDGTSGGTVYVSDGTNTYTSSATFSNLGYISNAATDWNTGSTWLGGVVPAASSTVTVANNITLNAAATNNPTTITVNASSGITFGASGTVTVAGTLTNGGSIVMTSGGTLTLGSGSTLANGTSIFTRGTGTVAFAGTGTITGTIGFNNVTLAGGVTFSSTSTINGTLTINAGGYVNTIAPIYANGSTLKYNSGTSYGRGTEWSATSGNGYPCNVQISGNTLLGLGANGGTVTARQCSGNLTVDGGCTFSMNEVGWVMTAAVTVMGNVVNNGTITLSGSSGGDLKTQGNINDNGTFTANSRAIFFNGSNTQVIQGTGTFDISYVRINKTGGSVQLATNLTCAGPGGGNAMEIDGTTSVLDLNGFTLYLGASGLASTYNIGIGTPGSIKGSTSSSIFILGTGTLGTIYFVSGSQALNNLTVNRTLSGTLTIGTDLTVSGALTSTAGTMSMATGKTLTLSSVSTTPQTQCASGTFSAALTVNSTGATYQWYSNITSSNTGGTLISGATSASYTPITATGTKYYYCAVSGLATAVSNVSGLFTVNPTTAISGQSTGNQTQCIGGSFSQITVTASGTGTLTYQWYSNTSASNTGGTSLVAANGAQTSSYIPQSGSAGTLYYYCIVTGTCSTATTTISGAFIVNAATAISSQSTATQTQPYNGTFTAITVTATGTGTLTYQWFSNTSNANSGGTTLNSSNGAQTASYTPQATTAGTLYYYCVITGTCGSVTSSVSGALVTLNNITTADFRSAVTGNWNTAANWEFNSTGSTWAIATQVPGAGNNVTIQASYPVTITVAADANALTVDGVLTVNAGTSLTVNSILTNNIAEGIVLVSPGNTGAPGSLITFGTVTGSGTLKAERYIPAWTTNANGWHLISSPVVSPSISSNTNLTPGTNDDFYSWSESTNYWLNQKVGDNAITNMATGVGYLVAYASATPTKFMTGIPNNSAVSYANLTITAATPPDQRGWHLVGNPYPCAIAWNNSSYALNNIEGTAKLMGDAGGYTDVIAGGIIPSMQGFSVKATNTSNSFTIPLNARTHSSASWTKSSENNSVLIVANDLETQMLQESWIRVNDQATDGYDQEYDSHFLPFYAPKFYSKVGDEMLSTNSLPSLPAEAVIPFGFVKNDATNFSIELKQSIDGLPVYLTDLKTNTDQNLTENPVYTFTSEAGDDPNRFLLHFLNTTGTVKPTAAQIKVYFTAGKINISGVDGKAEIFVRNMMGQLVLRNSVNGSTLNTVNTANLPVGVYVVSVVSASKTVSQKVVVR